MNKKRALSILMAAAMAAGTLVTSVPVYADDVEEITWMFWDDRSYGRSYFQRLQRCH